MSQHFHKFPRILTQIFYVQHSYVPNIIKIFVFFCTKGAQSEHFSQVRNRNIKLGCEQRKGIDY